MEGNSPGYLSRDKAHLAALQRQRRSYMVRMDYMPSKDAQRAIQAHRERCRPGSQSATNSAVLDAIVLEWADLTGINYQDLQMPMTSGRVPELVDAMRARMTSGAAKNSRVQCGARRHRDGQPCQAKSEPGKRRCRFHGGRSTGPRTPEGKARALANLRRGSSAASMA